jgi:ABC-type Fe3+/spermidine/putrescine transport system ATPase subunit
MSDRIAVMNGGRVEQIGSPREIYEHPETAFVADFIGSLNALEIEVGELVGSYALTRYGEHERVVVPVGSTVRVGDAVRIAVRPERVLMGPRTVCPTEAHVSTARSPRSSYPHVHAVPYDTRLGRVVCHRLADESLDAFETGSPVA